MKSLNLGMASAALILATAGLAAQPASESPFSSAVTLEGSYSAASDVVAGSAVVGEVETVHSKLDWLGTWRSSESFSWLTGAKWGRFGFDAPAGALIPDDVHSIALLVGAEWKFREGWFTRLEVEPGVYTDGEDFSSDDLNAPVALRLGYSPHERLTWVVAVRVDPRSDIPVIGGPGIRWKFHPDWTLNLLLPRPRIEYAISESVTLFAGGEITGGTWRVAEDFGTRRSDTRFDNDVLDYREIRVGVGARWKVAPGWRLTADAGWAVDRRFTFDRERLLLNGDGAPYLQAGIVASF
ncbi:MAG: hypothetical protein JNN07_15080 [Verrucomicrobiales bacterium]|nr:hypothetical protein [Verrucomicrobiales bacterium]